MTPDRELRLQEQPPSEAAVPRRSPGLQHLFRAYHERGDMQARDTLIRRFTPLASRLARRYAHPGGEPVDDLVQVATLGLIKAIDRFEPARGFAFASFATPTILGELRRYFRDATWAVHLPRQVQEDVLRVEQATQALGTRLGRSPTVAEIAQQAQMEPDQVLDALAAVRSTQTRSLDAPVGNDGEDEDTTLGDQQGSRERGYDLVEYGASASHAVKRLSERDREILRLRFVEDRTQSEIAAQVGLSQMQVSRVLAKCLRAMREAAGADLLEG
ncbi:SigB/SigF/SigG family RNA polymerase sigma factor [Conexibacter sp. SYSU D00693]|uniref:SigB/SigF/SigG family RNA polymerase sigma factor n=1 Tax=Conexibacter sp. SYSU D00693 TaxID=2812560 RepID=UPI00196B794F|nr:SigB/SigF/SigG family RNA polymerase sigma factor [Conexibacter sp. SYSU D00693]